MRSSRVTTGVFDTGGKWEKSSIRKILTTLLGHLWIVELTHINIVAFKFTLRYLQPDINPIVCLRCSWHRWQICHRHRWYRWQFATGVVDTGGKFAASIVDTGGKFATGINNTSETGGKICRRCTAPAATNYPSLRNSLNGCQGHLPPCLSPPDRPRVTKLDSNALYQPLPPPLPAPPPVSHASALIVNPVNLTRGTQGCPKITSFDKSNWHPNFWRVFSSLLFLCCFTPVYFRNTLCQKMHSLLPSVINENPFPALSFVTVFHLSLMNTNYSYRRIFGTSLLTLFGVSLVLWRRERLITSIATRFIAPCPRIHKHLHFSFTVVTLSKIFVRSRRVWEKNCRMGIRHSLSSNRYGFAKQLRSLCALLHCHAHPWGGIGEGGGELGWEGRGELKVRNDDYGRWWWDE